ncbi:thiamine-monophosphate kinase [Pelagibacteraceae bacterium GOM-A3]|nr:thiamine-monophosphate kinase [Pelagibacteraceae bacterium GOM-A3]
MDEFTLIEKYFKKLTYNNPSALKLNDDVFFDKKNNVVISTDTYIEGVHFLSFRNPDLVIKKIVRSSISDLYCKGVKPKFIFIGASGNNNSFSKKNLNIISKSLKEEQKKYGIKLSGGDTTKSNKTIFTIMSLGYSKRIVQRNKSKNGDDIYVTGNIGDSYLGLQILKRKVLLNKKEHNYFVNKYYLPDLPFKISSNLLNFANSSIDISDGLFGDLTKLINKSELFYKVDLNKVPISINLRNYLTKSKKKKINFVSKGDDYQILFTSPKSKRNYIQKFFKKMNQKVTLIGNLTKDAKNNEIIEGDKRLKDAYNQAYSHNF